MSTEIDTKRHTLTHDDIVPVLEIHGNQAVRVSITAMLCYESEPQGYQKESQMTCNEPFGFFVCAPKMTTEIFIFT